MAYPTYPSLVHDRPRNPNHPANRKKLPPNVGALASTPSTKEKAQLSEDNGVTFIQQYTFYAASNAWSPAQMLANLPKHTNRDLQFVVEYLVRECADWEAVVKAIEENFGKSQVKRACDDWMAMREEGLDVHQHKLEILKFEAVHSLLRGRSVKDSGQDFSLGADLLGFCRADLRAKVWRKLGDNAPTYEMVKRCVLEIVPKMLVDIEVNKNKTEGLNEQILEELRQLRLELQLVRLGGNIAPK